VGYVVALQALSRKLHLTTSRLWGWVEAFRLESDWFVLKTNYKNRLNFGRYVLVSYRISSTEEKYKVKSGFFVTLSLLQYWRKNKVFV
jgi:hypothetical protein